MTKVLCIGAHNDEIMADMGGTALILHEKGCETLFLNLACQWNSDSLSEAEKNAYRTQELASAEILGGKLMTIGNREDLLFLESKQIIEETARVILDFMPDIVFIHPPRDNHTEHREVASASFKALCAANVRGSHVKEIYSYDTGFMQSIDYFKPHFCVDVTEQVDTVKKSLIVYDQNCAQGKTLCHSYENKRHFRGRCAGGIPFAEAFRIVKFPNRSDDILLKRILGNKWCWYGNGMYPSLGEEYF